ncbi:MAG: HD domain-containing protein [Desulfurococcales archaeon]|nr:HD domain-containing protein [Desulfurococcales archaeon]
MEKLLEVLEALKNMPRTGWVQRGVPPALAEVVASHIYEASIICLEIGYRLAGLSVIGYEDVMRSVAMVLVHDIGEGVIGDLNRYISKELGKIKEEIEERAVRAIGSETIYNLYKEYRNGDSKASRLAHICDRLSTYIQAKRYLALGYKVDEIAKSSIDEARNLLKDVCRGDIECLRIAMLD